MIIFWKTYVTSDVYQQQNCFKKSFAFFYKYISAPTKLPYVIFVMFKRIDEIDMTLKDEVYLELPFGQK